MIANQTPFYGESGGQVGDIGTIFAPSAKANVTDTQKRAEDLHVHSIKMLEGCLKVGDDITLIIDSARRASIRSNHSATHLVHEALRRRLGDHVMQKGLLRCG